MFGGQTARVALAANGGRHEISQDVPGSRISGQSDVSCTQNSVYGIAQGTTFSHPETANSVSHWSCPSSQVANTAPA